MGVHDISPFLWQKRERNPLRRNGAYGVDVSGLLYAIISCASVYRRLTRVPAASIKAEAAAWLDHWRSVHKFEELNIKLAFVFDGRDKGLKRLRRLARQAAETKWNQSLLFSETWQQADKANANLARVNGHVIRAFCDWARDTLDDDKYVLFGAPFEADAQLIYIEREGFTNGSLSEDSDLFFIEGSKNIYSGFNTRSTKKYRVIINRNTVTPYLSQLRGHQLRAFASFCGTDYIDHLKGVGKWVLCSMECYFVLT